MAVRFLDQGFGEQNPRTLDDFFADQYEKSDQAFYRLALHGGFNKPSALNGLTAVEGANIGGAAGSTQEMPDQNFSFTGDTVFERALKIVFVSEGGFTIDNGGPTMRGVTWSAYISYHKRLGLPYITSEQAHVPGGIFETTVTKEVAAKIFKMGYWDQSFGDQLVAIGFPKAALINFDTAVNGGPGRAKQFLREFLKVNSDSQIAAALSTLPATTTDLSMANWLNDRMNAFRKMARNRKTGALLWNTYGRGWQRRYEYLRRLIPAFK